MFYFKITQVRQNGDSCFQLLHLKEGHLFFLNHEFIQQHSSSQRHHHGRIVNVVWRRINNNVDDDVTNDEPRWRMLPVEIWWQNHRSSLADDANRGGESGARDVFVSTIDSWSTQSRTYQRGTTHVSTRPRKSGPISFPVVLSQRRGARIHQGELICWWSCCCFFVDEVVNVDDKAVVILFYNAVLIYIHDMCSWYQ